jgi:hypothetical protein
MNKAAKLREAMQNHPLGWQIGDLQVVARQHEIIWRHEGGSHCVFIRSDGRTLPVPAHRPIKPIYIKKFLRLVAGE